MKNHRYCYPREDSASSAERFGVLSTAKTVDEMGQMVDVPSAPYKGFYPLRREQAGPDLVGTLRTKLLTAAMGAKAEATSPSKQRSSFDRDACVAVHETMQILPSDAADTDTWRWLNTWAVPDLLFWRFGNWSPGRNRWVVTADRIHTRQKGFLSRLWWRTEFLGPQLAIQIGEDEAVALIERTTAVGYRRFAQILTEEHLDFSAQRGITNRGDFLRDVMKRVIRRKAVVEVAALSDSDARSLVRDLLDETQFALGVGT